MPTPATSPTPSASPRLVRLTRWSRALTGLVIGAAALLVAACGSAEGMGADNPKKQAQLRLLNASLGATTVDLRVDDNVLASGVAYGTASSAVTLSTDSHDVVAQRSSAASALQEGQTITLAGKSSNTLLAYARNGGLQTLLLGDNLDSPPSNRTRLRVVHAAPDAGALDVYLTGSGTALSEVNPVVSALTVGSGGSSTTDVSSGSWRLRVTGSGDKADLRLDLASLTLASRDIVTLVLTPSSGGVLVHALSYSQGSDAVARRDNPSARVRLIAGSPSGGALSASLGGTPMPSTGPSPDVGGAYTWVTAGTGLALNLAVGATAVTTAPVDLTAGSDVTLLVFGPSTAAAYALFSDDNGLPSGSAQARVRLINGLTGVGSDGISMGIDAAPKATGVLPGQASAAVTVGTSSDRRLTVTLSNGTVAFDQAATLSAQGVYTLFAVGDAADGSGGTRKLLLRADR
jgi:hypothetical protein